MLDRIFPQQFDNAFRGHRLAIWLLIPIVVLRLIMGANSILITRAVATSADGIALSSFNAPGAEAVLSLFALLGLSLLMLALQGVLVLIRYRAMIPFFYLLLLLQELGPKALALAHPMARSGAGTGAAFVLAMLAMTLIGFVLSLANRSPSLERPLPHLPARP